MVGEVGIAISMKFDEIMLSLISPASYVMTKDKNLLIRKMANKDLKIGEFIKTLDTI